MLKQITHIWRNNNGTFLFACGVAVMVVMSVLWRFDMIPDFGSSLRGSPIFAGGRVTALPNIVAVSITSEDAALTEVQMLVLSTPDLSNESLSPIESRTTNMRNGLSEFLIFGLPRGAYGGIAYVDVNNNGQLDFAEDKSPAEPYGFARVTSPEPSQPLPNGVFEVTGDPTFIKIQLKKPKFPVSP